LLLKDFIPAPDVQEFIQLYRIVHLQFEPGMEPPPKAYPPRPEHCLAFYPFDTEKVQYNNSARSEQHIPIVLYGQFDEVTHRIIGNNFLVFQIIFFPGAMYRLTGMPSTEIHNEYIDATSVFGNQLHHVNEMLAEAKDYSSMIRVADDFVRKLIKSPKKNKRPLDDAFSLLLAAENCSVDKIARQSFLSVRQLERQFKERTGVTPKLYERIIRFDKAFRLKNSQPGFDWLRIAVECGYHDYQHLSKAYKDFTGLTPTGFHAMEEKAPERLFGLSEGFYNRE
jgi:AraC-like DNA-binding protein